MSRQLSKSLATYGNVPTAPLFSRIKGRNAVNQRFPTSRQSRNCRSRDRSFQPDLLTSTLRNDNSRSKPRSYEECAVCHIRKEQLGLISLKYSTSSPSICRAERSSTHATPL